MGIHKVIYRGYTGSKQLEKLQNEAVKGRLEKESASLEQELKDLQSSRDAARAETEEKHKHQLAQLKEINDEKARYLHSLKQAGVDITEYLISQLKAEAAANLMKVPEGSSAT